MKCKKCGNTKFETRRSGPNRGLYCTECGTWARWMRKVEESGVYDYSEDSEVVAEEAVAEEAVAEEAVAEEAVAEEAVAEEAVAECYYCDKDYVIPVSYDGGISSWDIVDAHYCPVCGRQRK